MRHTVFSFSVKPQRVVPKHICGWFTKNGPRVFIDSNYNFSISLIFIVLITNCKGLEKTLTCKILIGVWSNFNPNDLVKEYFRFLSCGKNAFATLQNTADTQLAINRKRIENVM